MPQISQVWPGFVFCIMLSYVTVRLHKDGWKKSVGVLLNIQDRRLHSAAAVVRRNKKNLHNKTRVFAISATLHWFVSHLAKRIILNAELGVCWHGTVSAQWWHLKMAPWMQACSPKYPECKDDYQSGLAGDVFPNMAMIPNTLQKLHISY